MFSLAPLLVATLATIMPIQQEIVDGLSDATSWMYCGPFENGGSGIAEKHKPEKSVKKHRKQDEWSELKKEYKLLGGNKGGWRQLPPTARTFFGKASGYGPLASGQIDFNNIEFLQEFGDAWNTNTAIYLYRGINSDRNQKLQFFTGSDDGLKIWFNGEEVLVKGTPRGLNPYDDVTEFELKKGLNHILIKVPNAGGAWKFEMRPFSQPPQEWVDDTIKRGVDWLIARQLIDGSWDHYQGSYRNGQTALSAYTLIKMGVSPQHPSVLRAFNFLEAQPSVKTYSIGCQLLAVASANDPAYRPWIEEMVGDLISWQRRSGSWAYPTGTEDLSVTQFAALGLWAAAQQGVTAPNKVWNQLVEGTLDYIRKEENVRVSGGREKGAGFAYHAGGQATARGSMTAAGVATLQLCKEHLGSNMRPDLVVKVDRAIERGNNWLAAKFRVDVNPEYSGRHYYWLYGLERAGAFLETEFFGPHEWYPHGAWRIMEDQMKWDAYGADLDLSKGLGSWGSESDTCFALLFLRQATRKIATGPDVASNATLLKSLPAQGPVILHSTFQNRLTLWVPEIDTTEKVVRVEYWKRLKGAKEWELFAEVETTPENGNNNNWSMQAPLVGHGKWQLRATAVTSDQQALDSGILEVEVKTGVDPIYLEYGDDGFDNLLSRANPTATVSSGNSGNSLVDNKVFTAWTCSSNDAEPSFVIETKRALRVKRILFVPAKTRPMGQKSHPRASRIEVHIGEEEEEIWMDLDPQFDHKTVLEFDEIKVFKKLKVILHDPIDGKLGVSSVGFSEVEYQK